MTHQTQTIETKTIQKFMTEISSLEKRLAKLKAEVAKFLPVKYGSDAWWEREEKKADEDIKAGRVYGPFSDINNLLKELHK